jgi:hypothetical protein
MSLRVIIVPLAALFISIVVSCVAAASLDHDSDNKPAQSSLEETGNPLSEEPVEPEEENLEPQQPKPVPRARWSEDWSVLREVPLRDTMPSTEPGFLRPIKYIPLTKSGNCYLSFGGEYRIAFEMYNEADMGISDIGYQDALQHRLTVHADWHLNQNWRIFCQLGYAAVNGREGGANAVDETAPDIWQLFIDSRFTVAGSDRVVIRLGRQMIETANVFITAGEAHNIRLVYNGGRVAWIQDDFIPFEAFAAEYVDYADGWFDMSGTGEYFWGLRGGFRHEETETAFNFLYLGWSLKDRQFEQGGADRHDELRHSLMAWINRPLIGDRQWGIDYYLVYQFGSYDDQPGGSDIQAFAAFGEVKYAIYPQAKTPIVGLKTSYFSGDHNPDDNVLNTFYDPVFGTPYFSYARDIMPFNLIQIQPNISYRFSDRLLVVLSHEFLWRANPNDAYYDSANAILVRAGVSDSRWLGQQTQFAVHYKPIDQIIINAYWSHFFAGTVIDDAGGSDRDYDHVGVNFLF